jgi:hypothetical protein
VANIRQLNIELYGKSAEKHLPIRHIKSDIVCGADSPSRFSASLLLRVLAVLCAMCCVLYTVLSVLLTCIWVLCYAMLCVAILCVRSVQLCLNYHSQHTVIVLLNYKGALSSTTKKCALLFSTLLFSSLLCTALRNE